MIDWLGEANTVALIGLIGGLVLGLAARIGRFCTLGAIEDYLYSSDDRRIRMWGVAISIAILTTQAAIWVGAFDPSQTAYLDRVWSPVATIIGGLMFGYGMAVAGNCGYGALARLGGGDLRALVLVLIMGLSAYVVMSGPLAHTRVWLFPVETNAATPSGYGHLMQKLIGLNPVLFNIGVGVIVLILSLSRKKMRQSWSFVFWGVVVGLAISSGWIGTHWVSSTGFANEPVETHTFTAPVGDTLFYLMTASGNTLSFSVGSIAGVIVGSFIGSVFKGHFRWEACEDPRELKRQISGAVFMGVGAILAVGCSIGQGISAMSVLAYSAPIALISIFIGAKLGLAMLIEGSIKAAWQS